MDKSKSNTNVLQECMVESCVRKIQGTKTPASFLIERTCRYARSNECRSRFRVKTKTVSLSIMGRGTDIQLLNLENTSSKHNCGG